jgi:hypothetical protein
LATTIQEHLEGAAAVAGATAPTEDAFFKVLKEGASVLVKVAPVVFETLMALL